MTGKAAAGAAPQDRRWTVIGALGIQQILSWGATYFLLSVLAPAITADTGWPLPWVVGALSVALVADGIAAPFVGRAIIRHGGRRVLAAGVGIIALGLMLMAFAQALWMYLLAWMVIGVGMAAGLYDPAFSTLGQLYGLSARRSITALTLWGGFSITLCWPLSAFLLETFDWRITALVYAGLCLCLSLPLILWLVPRPVRIAEAPTQRSAQKLVFTRRERASFVTLAAIQTLSGFMITLLSLQLVTVLQAQGLSQAEAVGLGALLGPAQFAARLLEMAGGGRHHPIWSMLAAIGFDLAGLTLLAAGAVPPALALVLVGAGNGILSIARGALPLSLFGSEAYPLVMGRLSRPSLMAQACAPVAGGLLVSGLGEEAVLICLAGAAAIAFLLVLVLMRIRPR